MKYFEAISKAKTINSKQDLNKFLTAIEEDNNINTLQYYNLRHIAIEAAYKNID